MSFPPNGAPEGAPAPMPSSAGRPAMPPHPGMTPGGRGIPPQLQRFINPNNPLQTKLLMRLNTMTPQDAQAIASPQVLAVLKKLMPEVAFVFDLLAQRAHPWQGAAGRMAAPPGAMPPGAPNMQPAPGNMQPAPGNMQAPAPAAPAPRPPQFGGPPRPQTKLGGM